MTISLPSRFQNAATRQADMTQDMLDLSNIVTQINAGASPIQYVTLDTANLTASIPIPTTPTVLIVPTVQTQQNITFDPLTGIATVVKPGNYQVLVLLNVFPTTVNTIFYGLEVDTGSGFVSSPTSGRQQGVNLNINGQVTFASNSFFAPVGLRARIYVWAAAGAATFQTTALTALPGGPNSVSATRVLITGT